MNGSELYCYALTSFFSCVTNGGDVFVFFPVLAKSGGFTCVLLYNIWFCLLPLHYITDRMYIHKTHTLIGVFFFCFFIASVVDTFHGDKWLVSWYTGQATASTRTICRSAKIDELARTCVCVNYRGMYDFAKQLLATLLSLR